MNINKYKYWITEKLEKLLKELSWRERNVAIGMSDIIFKNMIENILIKRGE